MDMNIIIDQLRSRAGRMTSLDTPKDADLVDAGADIAAGFIPGVGSALGARDVVRGYREGDPIGMVLGAAGMVPIAGGAARAVGKARKASKSNSADLVQALRADKPEPRQFTVRFTDRMGNPTTQTITAADELAASELAREMYGARSITGMTSQRVLPQRTAAEWDEYIEKAFGNIGKDPTGR